MFNINQHHLNSSLRENIVEHLFVGDALRLLWRKGVVDVEILRSEFDAFGYDLVISAGSLVRHVQLKSGTKLKPVSTARLLAEKPSGCIVFIEINDGLDLLRFHSFSSKAGMPLPDISAFKTAKRTTPKSDGTKPEPMKHVVVPISKFEMHATLDDLLSSILDVPFLAQRSHLKKMPLLLSDTEAESFTASADLSECDLTGFKSADFSFLEKK
ncbi:hypothetical protein [Pseudorhizobium marinum]|uniref:hypothetical protein n=1 Tax=Pseudorhizobium marinum TaxID=1496690 RepID=UPI0006911668|nr:hypothetical protein [Pseudorhizobium marinum]